ncbi:hypothetical protein ACVWYG_002154 [Pedobacter sp. UYEF25]
MLLKYYDTILKYLEILFIYLCIDEKNIVLLFIDA